MIFLIEYNRTQGKLVSFREFDDDNRAQAESLRLSLEIELNRKKIEHEIVLLEVASTSALRQTHGRYFESLRQLSLAPL